MAHNRFRTLIRPQCPLWVISGHLQCKKECPLYPRKRTFAAAIKKSGHSRDHAARSTRVSISVRSIVKSMGLVRSASAPFSSAFCLVSASP